MPSILITGASGFVGSFLVEEALRRGFHTWAGVRAGSSRRYLQQPALNFLELNLADPDGLTRRLNAHKEQHGPLDYVVHCAGVTKCADPADFDRVNHRQTCLLADTLARLHMLTRRMVFISSLSVMGPVREDFSAPISDADTPRPDTAYGRSKLAAEQHLQTHATLPCIILRPTGIYGPRERDYYQLALSIRRHMDFAAGLGRQDLTFVYVADVVQAAFLALEHGTPGHAYFLTDGQVYSSRTFSDLVRKELGNPFVARLKCPLPLLKALSSAAGRIAARMHTTCVFNPDKYRIMKQRNWQCDIGPARRELGYRPQYDLQRGVHETIAWYKANKWL